VKPDADEPMESSRALARIGRCTMLATRIVFLVKKLE